MAGKKQSGAKARKTKKAAEGKAAPQAPLKQRSVRAALDLSATLGWDMVTLSDIAAETGSTLADLREIFDDKTDILIAYGRMLDQGVLESAGMGDPSASERDRLFDLFMERFDRLNHDRAAVLSMLASFGSDPAQGLLSLPHLGRSMMWMIEAAGGNVKGLRGCIKLSAVTAVYLASVKTWMKDGSEDLSQTMSVVDKHLDRMERGLAMFRL